MIIIVKQYHKCQTYADNIISPQKDNSNTYYLSLINDALVFIIIKSNIIWTLNVHLIQE